MNRNEHSKVCKFDLSSFRILYKYRNRKRNWSTKPMLPWTGYLIFGTVICSCRISLSRIHSLRRGRLNPDNQNFTGAYLPEQHLLIYFSSNINHIKTGHSTFSDSKKRFQSLIWEHSLKKIWPLLDTTIMGLFIKLLICCTVVITKRFALVNN